MTRKKIVFLGSKPIGHRCFEHLVKGRDTLNYEITGLLTKERSEFGTGFDLKELAEQHNIPVLNSMDDIPECDIIYSIQYHQILKPVHIEKAKQIAVNLHMAPLPEYRGCNSFSYAIIDKKIEFGSTIHRIDAKIDHGDILFQSRFLIPYGSWVNDLYDLTFRTSVVLFKETLPELINEEYTLTPQKSLEAKYGTSLHFRNEIEELKKLDFVWDREKIERHIRATFMPGFEPPYFIVDGKKMYITEAGT